MASSSSPVDETLVDEPTTVESSVSEAKDPQPTSPASGTENAEEAPPPPPPSVDAETTSTAEKWPGWPGYNVFRLIVPVLKVGGIIGRKGELVKKMCEDTHSCIRILEGAVGTADRIVLISGKEDPYVQLSPAMDAALRVFRCVSGLSPGENDATGSAAATAAAGAAFCSIRLLVASSQATLLIGKQGSTIKSIQESSSASVRILSQDEVPSYATSEERIVEIHGDGFKVLKALEAVLGQLRKFLVDQSVVPIFEKRFKTTLSQERAVESWGDKAHSLRHPSPAPARQTGIDSDFSISTKHFEREAQLDSKIQHSGLSLYGQDPGHGGVRSTGFGRIAVPIVTQMTKTMQIPLSYAEDIIGIGGANIAYIRRTSGAVLTVQESRGLPDEITVEIKGTSSQVQAAEQLIQEFISSHKEATPSMFGSSSSRSNSGLNLYGGGRWGDNPYLSPPYQQSQSIGGGGYGSSTYTSFRY